VLSDCSPAIASIANAFGKSLLLDKSDYLFGLWRHKLRQDLCWKTLSVREFPGAADFDASRNLSVPSFSWASTNLALHFMGDFFHRTRADGEGVEVLGYREAEYNAPPHFQLQGLMFDFSALSSDRSKSAFLSGWEDPGLSAICWDTPDSEKSSDNSQDVRCICFGIITKMEGAALSWDEQALFGILVEPQADVVIDGHPAFRRIGFLDGVMPNVDPQSIARESVAII
jgi:hypothetical protein